jgi:hypothetical protein
MSTPSEAVLATLPCARDDERTILVHCQSDHGSQIELRQQSWGAGVGWFTQSTVRLDPEQVAGLRAALGKAPANHVPAYVSRLDFGPRVVQFESA